MNQDPIRTNVRMDLPTGNNVRRTPSLPSTVEPHLPVQPAPGRGAFWAGYLLVILTIVALVCLL